MSTDGNWWDTPESVNFKSVVDDNRMDLFAGRIPDEQSLNAMVVRHLYEREQTRPVEINDRAPGFHPSDLGHFCARYETLARTLPIAGPARTFEPELYLRFAIGHAVHHHWQQILGRMGVLRGGWQCSRCVYRVNDSFMPTDPCPKCRWQINPVSHHKAAPSRASIDCAAACRWPGGYDYGKGRDCRACERGGSWKFRETSIRIPEFEIVGHTDGVVLYNCVERILEMKTIDVFAFEHLSGPKPEHELQAQIYMWGLDKKEAVVAYINKNTGHMKEYLVSFNPEVIAQVKAKIQGVHQAVASGTAPLGVCGGPKEDRAKSCGYRAVCFKGHDSIVKIAELMGRPIPVVTTLQPPATTP